MALRGQPSTAHVYDARHCCIYCSMYENVVIALVHQCTPARELEVDGQTGQAGTADGMKQAATVDKLTAKRGK